MGGFIDFLINYYWIFLIILIVLIFALIGYFVDSKGRGHVSKVDKKVDGNKNEVKLEPLSMEANSPSLTEETNGNQQLNSVNLGEMETTNIVAEPVVQTSVEIQGPLVGQDISIQPDSQLNQGADYDQPLVVEESKKDSSFEIVEK